MELFTAAELTAAITALVNGAAGEAGKSMWKSLKDFVTVRKAERPEAVAALTTAEQTPTDQSAVARFAGALEEIARADPAAATWLRSWLTQAGAPAPAAINVIGGQPTMHGPVIMSQNIGDIHL